MHLVPAPAPGSLVLVDAAPLVYLIEGPDRAEPAGLGSLGRRKAAVEAFLAEAAALGLGLIASTLIWTELLHRPIRLRDLALADRYRAFLADSSRIVLIPLDVAIAEEAARLRAARDLAHEDATHIATALVAGARAVLSNDESWRAVPECPPLFLVDELAFDLDL